MPIRENGTSMSNHDSDPCSASPTPSPEADSLGGLTLRLRPIDPGSAPAAVIPKVKHRKSAEDAQSLTTFDWLDTIVGDLIYASGLGKVDLVPTQDVSAPATDFANASIEFDRSTVLGQVVLGYSPVMDRQQAVVATRLTVAPMRANAVLDATALLEAISEVWPASGGLARDGCRGCSHHR
jgi:hypothetical protein